MFRSTKLNKSKFLLNFGECTTRVVGCFLRALFHLRLQRCLVIHQILESLLNVRQRIGSHFTNRQLEVAISLSRELALDFVELLTRKAGIDAHQIADAGLILTVTDLTAGIGNSALEFADNGIPVIQI